MCKPIPKDIKRAVRDKYAWPGGYPLYLVMTDGGTLCIDCSRKEWRQIAYATLHGLRDGWQAAAPDINYEDQDLHCDHCGNLIESAYGNA